MDGRVQKSDEMNVANDTYPLTLTFNVSDVTPFTSYMVFALATYDGTNCNETEYPGEHLNFTTKRKYTHIYN